MAKQTDKAKQLKELNKFCADCQKCILGSTRTNLVFGVGNPDARIMFTGEAPGADEDRLGVPFVGRAGKLLDQCLADIGIAREDVYIANIIKCRPPGNRDPLPAEIEACKELLFAQIAIIQPVVLCTLGRHAAETLLAIPDFKISRDHGKPMNWQGIVALPVFHPAAALHQPANLTGLRFDFQQLKSLLERKGG